VTPVIPAIQLLQAALKIAYPVAQESTSTVVAAELVQVAALAL
jgi:hypothetical protein